jgi:hypothetical protein
MSPASPSRLSCDSSTIRYPCLTSSQRSRLVQSTRKLTKVLGETPILQVVKMPSPKPLAPQRYRDNGTATHIVYVTKKLARAMSLPLRRVHRREAESDSDSMRGGRSGLIAANTPSHGRSWSPALFCEAKPSPEAEADHCNNYASSRVPYPNPPSKKRPPSLISISTSKSILLSPTEWEKWREGSEARSRRKRLSKLARYLGENIPPDLILPTRASSRLSKGSPRCNHIPPDYTPPVPPVVLASYAEPPTLAQETHLSLPSPPLTLDISPPPSVAKTIEVFESMGLMPSLRSTSDVEPPRPFAQQEYRRLPSESTLSLPFQRFMQPHTDECVEVDDHDDVNSHEDYKAQGVGVSSRPGSPLAFLRLRHTAPSPDPNAVSHRSERRQGWSGEWNAASIQDVISKLRDL